MSPFTGEAERAGLSFVEDEEHGASLGDVIPITEGDFVLPSGEMPVAISVLSALHQAEMRFETGWPRSIAYGVVDHREEALHAWSDCGARASFDQIHANYSVLA